MALRPSFSTRAVVSIAILQAIGLCAFVACGSDGSNPGGPPPGSGDGSAADGGTPDGAPSADGPTADGRTAVPDTCPSGAWCWENPHPTNGDIHAMWGASASDLWAVDGNGAISHFDGAKWQVRYQGLDPLHAIWGSAPNDIWAVGPNATIVHFDGQTWTKVHGGSAIGATSTDPGSDLAGVWGTGPKDVWAVTPNLSFLHYDGLAWSPPPSDPPVTTNCNIATDYKKKVAIWGRGTSPSALGCDGAIAYWNGSKMEIIQGGGPYDGDHISAVFPVANGQWVGGTNALYPPDKTITVPSAIKQVSAIAGTSDDDMWVTTYDGKIWHKRGSGWSQLASPTAEDLGVSRALLSVWTGGGKVLVGAGAGRILQPAGDTSFELQPGNLVTGHGLTSVSVLGDGERWAAGFDALHFTGGAWTVVDRQADGGTVAPDGGYSDNMAQITAVAPNEAWALAEDVRTGFRRVVHYDGTAWADSNLPASGDGWIGGLAATGRDNVWVVGNFGLAAEYNGSSWRSFPAPTTNSVGAVATLGPNDTWLYHGGGSDPTTVLHFDGTNWTDASATADGSKLGTFVGLYAAGPGDLWAPTGEANGVYHYTQGKWSLVTLDKPAPAGSAPAFVSVAGSGPNDVWVLLRGTLSYVNAPLVAYRSYLYHYDGAKWTSEPVPLTYGSSQLAVSSKRVWLVGGDGHILARGR